jgi:Rps23 Pro-64 3,4-dihydroxylase Tpa1-like proline 4-hydroxylase
VIAGPPAVSYQAKPFPHTVTRQALPASLTDRVLNWFETAAPWRLRIESFYEQYELNLHQIALPEDLVPLIGEDLIKGLIARMLSPLTESRLSLVEANAHKLLPGQTIRIHNDFIGADETHRVLIQVNRNWAEQNGGLLMLFASPSPDDVARLIRPLHGSCLGFEISSVSFHAVSKIHAGERYTLVYSFKHAD